MKRVGFFIFAFILLALPLFFIVYSNWDAIQEELLKAKFISRRAVSPQYTAETKVPGVQVAIVDSRFLEYIAATMHIYDTNAVADSEMYFGNRASTARHTVSHLKLELVPTLEQYMVGLAGSSDFAARGTYAVEDNTLVVRVSLNEAELAKSNVPTQFAQDDMFLDTALQTLVYATGKPGAPMSIIEMTKIQKAIKDNIPIGIFPRPIKIETKQ